MAAYMLAESAEERGHALEFVNFANKRNIPIQLQTIEAPNAQWESPEEVWADILKLEESNTESLLKVAEAANSCQDFAVLAFLNPFHVSRWCCFASVGYFFFNFLTIRHLFILCHLNVNSKQYRAHFPLRRTNRWNKSMPRIRLAILLRRSGTRTKRPVF